MEKTCIELSNKTAIEKQKNDKFLQYLKNTNTAYKSSQKKNGTMALEIMSGNEKDINNALDIYIYCTGVRNGIAYAN